MENSCDRSRSDAKIREPKLKGIGTAMRNNVVYVLLSLAAALPGCNFAEKFLHGKRAEIVLPGCDKLSRGENVGEDYYDLLSYFHLKGEIQDECLDSHGITVSDGCFAKGLRKSMRELPPLGGFGIKLEVRKAMYDHLDEPCNPPNTEK